MTSTEKRLSSIALGVASVDVKSDATFAEGKNWETKDLKKTINFVADSYHFFFFF